MTGTLCSVNSHNPTEYPCEIVAYTTEYTTVVHKLCLNSPSIMVFHSDTGLPVRSGFKWRLAASS